MRLSPSANDPEMRSKGFVTGKAKGISVEGARVQPTVQTDVQRPSVDLEVNFNYNSATLSPDAFQVLDNLGKALSDPELQSSSFMVAGHTDAAGSEAYNLALSKRRAQTVAKYLRDKHHIEPSRLRVEGYGKRRLLDAANPLSALNRRVEVVNLGAQ
ncbi:MAG: OmpA family protein [Proteobacteria bacterium]|nr:OmpA family protein [Pseudomonadota bacterium]